MRLNQVTLRVSDIERSAEFYRRLGLRQIVGGDDRYARFLCPEGDSTFSIESHGDAPVVPASAVVYFECDDVDATVAALAGRGIAIDAPPRDQPWLWREAYLRDPDGHTICIFHGGKNRIDPPWRLK